MTPQNWFVAIVPSRTEHKAQVSLQERGFESYVPTEKHWTVHARKRSVSKRAILPRYMFIRVEEGQSHYEARQAVPNLSFLSLAGKPDRIPTNWVVDFRANEAAGAFDYTKEPEVQTFAKHEMVRVTDGPYAGQIATIMKAKPGEPRVKVFLKALGRATVMAKDLERAA